MKSYNTNSKRWQHSFRPNAIFEIGGKYYRNPMGYTQAAIGSSPDTLWDDDPRVVEAMHMECMETTWQVSPRYEAGEMIVKVSENGELMRVGQP